MTAKRIGAAVVAVALIVGAVVLRRAVLDGDDATSQAATTPPTSTAAAGELVCVTELGALCRTLAPQLPDLTIRVEDAGVTLDALAALPDGETAPLWLTIQPYPEMVDSLRAGARLQPLGGSVEALAASRLAVALPTDGRADVLAAVCAEEPLWRCIGNHAGAPWTDFGGEPDWRTVRPSLGLVDRQAVALASLAVAVAGYLGTPDVASAAWESDPAFTPWFSRLSGAVPTSTLSAGTPLATMVVKAGALDIAATADEEVAALGGDRFAVNYPEPSMWVEAVLATPDGVTVPAGITATLEQALTASGWEPPDAATQSLPSATTMLALRTLWQQST